MNFPECEFSDDSQVKEIYQEIVKICDVDSANQKCLTENQDIWEYCIRVADNLKNLRNTLNEILKKNHSLSNGTLSDVNVEDVKKHCICLKQSFYNKLIKNVKKQKDVYERVRACKSDIKDKINSFSSNLCTFRNLNIREIERIKKIFYFYLFYYIKIMDFTVDQESKHQEYFKKGFYEHCNSITECLNNKSNSAYCEEFKEYHKKYNAFKVFLESLISYAKKVDDLALSEECILSERLLNERYLFELREEIERIRSRYLPTNYRTTAITVVFLFIGTVIGVFLILYYFFGITSRILLSHIRKTRNKETHTNVDDETEYNSLFTSENLENNSKRKGYSISYKSTNYS
ncbi:PIR Superfamily Protein [Plasmodium ovale curtisi]|uniref:PIR Superfamily Protein n=1 Tax=Plasmodium ovale curtisi TaxID=864141 RepID=A0A1A8WFW0_PLAOA|nr:PIR Superfamily Protein [Plasmodium ovale curtisi]